MNEKPANAIANANQLRFQRSTAVHILRNLASLHQVETPAILQRHIALKSSLVYTDDLKLLTATKVASKRCHKKKEKNVRVSC